MKAVKHYIEELKSGGWRWTHVQMGGFLPSKGPEPDEHGQILLNGKKYVVNPRFDHPTISPRPGWAIGLIVLGFMGIGGSVEFVAFPLGAAMFALFGLGAILSGIWSYQKSLHVYALFAEDEKFQIPRLMDFNSLKVIKEVIDLTAGQSSEGAKANKLQKFLHPEIPWPLIIASAIGGLGIGAIIGVLAAHIK